MNYRVYTKDELSLIIENHTLWLQDPSKGKQANLSSADLRSADLRYANLSSADLRSANFRSADLRSANFRSADLRYANLSSADLRSADLRYANLSSANLRYADLSSADLRYANLSYADLSSANLSYADLSSADLRYANLSYADLLIFQYQQNVAYFTMDGTMRIGCECMPISEWMIGFKEVGHKHGYSVEEIEAYGNFIKMCAKKFKEQSNK